MTFINKWITYIIWIKKYKKNVYIYIYIYSALNGRYCAPSVWPSESTSPNQSKSPNLL